MSALHQIGSGRSLFDVDFRDFPVTTRLRDCGGDMVLGTGCGKCSYCIEQASLISICGVPAPQPTSKEAKAK